MVEYIDGSVIAQMGIPDMRLPIQYALFYPERIDLIGGKQLDFTTLKQITFEEPDMDTFFGLALAYEAGRNGGSMPTVYNAANEWAVARFLENKIGFLAIPTIIKEAMKNHKRIENPSLIDILNVENETYDFVKEYAESEFKYKP
jgi:1-deoxy-D-xylulose-5-phosphate reductoisomerase